MIQLKNIHKRFGDLEVLKGIDLDIKTGEVVSIIGPSGTGKSTLLRCINYLEKADKGIITLDDITVNTEKPWFFKVFIFLKIKLFWKI